MQEGGQTFACLDRVEQFDKQSPDRACLLEIRCQLLLAMERIDDFRVTAKRFVDKHPENPVAWAEATILAAHDSGGRAAMAALQRASQFCGDGIPSRVYDAMGVVAHILLGEGYTLAARALFVMQTMLRSDDSTPLEMVLQLNASPQLPLILKDDPVLKPCPADAPWKPEFDDALTFLGKLRWQEAADRFTVLSGKAADSPAVWHNLATLRTWLADTAGAVEAWQRFASSDIPAEDAAEAEALAMFLSEDPLGDQDELLRASYEINDADQARDALIGARRGLAISPERLAAMAPEGPPPRAAFMLLDRPLPEAGEVASAAQLARTLGTGLVYGRETDRPARLEISVLGRGVLDAMVAPISAAVPELEASSPTISRLGSTSITRRLLRRDWVIPDGLSGEQIDGFEADLVAQAVLKDWVAQPLGVLGGRSPGEAAKDPASKVKLSGAILLIEYWLEQSALTFDLNRLREQLGLPALGPIDPTGIVAEQLPLGRLVRLELEKLSDESLMAIYRRAWSFRAGPAMKKIAEAVIARPTIADRSELEPAYRYLAETADSTERALQYIDAGRAIGRAAGESCAPWDFMELTVRLERGEMAEFQRLLNHLQTDHIREPGVADSLYRFLVEIGAIRPQQEPGMPAQAAAPAAEPGRLWTPGDPGPASGGSGKLWTPE